MRNIIKGFTVLSCLTLLLVITNCQAERTNVNDANSNDYTEPTRVVITANNIEIASGNTHNFGTLVLGSPVSVSVSIENKYTSTLTLGEITITGTDAIDFSVAQPGTTAVPAGGTASFNVTALAFSIGFKTALVVLPYTDIHGKTYTFQLAVNATYVPSCANDNEVDAPSIYFPYGPYSAYVKVGGSATETYFNKETGKFYVKTCKNDLTAASLKFAYKDKTNGRGSTTTEVAMTKDTSIPDQYYDYWTGTSPTLMPIIYSCLSPRFVFTDGTSIRYGYLSNGYNIDIHPTDADYSIGFTYKGDSDTGNCTFESSTNTSLCGVSSLPAYTDSPSDSAWTSTNELGNITVSWDKTDVSFDFDSYTVSTGNTLACYITTMTNGADSSPSNDTSPYGFNFGFDATFISYKYKAVITGDPISSQTWLGYRNGSTPLNPTSTTYTKFTVGWDTLMAGYTVPSVGECVHDMRFVCMNVGAHGEGCSGDQNPDNAGMNSTCPGTTQTISTYHTFTARIE